MPVSRPAAAEEADPLDRMRPLGTGDDGMIPDQYLHWEMGTMVGLNRMPWIRELWLKGGRRIRKTDFLIKRLIQKALRRPAGSDLAYINRTFKQARVTAFKRFKRKLAYPNNWLLDGQINENQMAIPIIGGRTIYLLGSEDPDSARGFELTDVAIDEASVNESLAAMLGDVILPMLSDKKGTLDAAMTARGRGFHFQQHRRGMAYLPDPNEPGRRIKHEQREEQVLSLEIPTAKVGTVPASDLARFQREWGDDLYGQEFDCWDLDYVGLAVHQFLRHDAPEGNILPHLAYTQLRPLLTFFGVIDYARSSGSTVREVFAVDEVGRVVMVDEIVLPGGTPERVAQQVKKQDERLGIQTLVNVCGRDCWHKESNGKAMADQLIARQIHCIPCAFSLADAVTELNQRCKTILPVPWEGEDGDGLPMFLVLAGRCPKLVEQICKIEHADLEKKSQHMKDALDCARMAVMMNYRAVPGSRLPAGGIHQGRIAQLLAAQTRGGGGSGRRLHPISGRPL